jgi:hypothetical protein
MTTVWQVQVSQLRLHQEETQKELRLRTLMPSVPALSLSKGWIGRLRENYEDPNPHTGAGGFFREP